jgi:DNA-binding IclR family transcriptional regulator
VQPVVRSLAILKALARRESGLGLQDLADELGLPISTVHRLTAVLMDQGFLIRVPGTKHFLLGPEVRTLLAGTSSYYIRNVAEPHMRNVNRETQENVFLAELVGSEVVCFDFMPGIRQLRLYVNVGTVIPLHAGASSRVLLAYMTPQSARELLEAKPLERLRPNTMTDPDEVMEHLQLVRERGYDVCDDEMEARVFAAACPIMDQTGEVRASIAVLMPEDEENRDTERRELLINSVRTAAARISEDLGWDGASDRQLGSPREEPEPADLSSSR